MKDEAGISPGRVIKIFKEVFAENREFIIYEVSNGSKSLQPVNKNKVICVASVPAGTVEKNFSAGFAALQNEF